MLCKLTLLNPVLVFPFKIVMLACLVWIKTIDRKLWNRSSDSFSILVLAFLVLFMVSGVQVRVILRQREDKSHIHEVPQNNWLIFHMGEVSHGQGINRDMILFVVLTHVH